MHLFKSKRWMPLVVAALVAALPATGRADDGEFWDAAVASISSRAKKVERSHLALRAGGARLLGRDVGEGVTAAPWRVLGELDFYGFKMDRYVRILAAHGGVGIGVDEGAPSTFESAAARLRAFQYWNNGSLSFGVFGASREKARRERLGAFARAFEYQTGGAMKAFAFALTTSALGYEYRQTLDNANYHGLYVVGLGLQTGFVIGRKEKVSFETNVGGDVGICWPKKRSLDAALELALHLNHKRLPVEWSVAAGYSFFDEGEDAAKVAYDHFHLTSMIGVRY